MYAKPVPKSQRLYANTSGTPAQQQVNTHPDGVMQHSTPQSPSGSSSQSSYTHNIASSLAYRQHLANSLLTQNAGGDERVPSISPPICEGAQSEQIRLISSLSNTPTKSILKKPKHETSRTPQSRDICGDQSSQSSSGNGSSGGGKDHMERLSESSNVSFSDRDSPTADQPAGASALPVLEDPQPDFSPSNTYLETSFEVGEAENVSTVPPATLPKPKLPSDGVDLDSTMDRKVRNITQV